MSPLLNAWHYNVGCEHVKHMLLKCWETRVTVSVSFNVFSIQYFFCCLLRLLNKYNNVVNLSAMLNVCIHGRLMSLIVLYFVCKKTTIGDDN